ncbi:hypothetical protein [Candidatus Pelagibacter sp. Uisw_136]|uniref:hypothetical protein n=1 Tax=Candidatus Pelagibacter sp. Uisw_136 TaxID=3230991 RepID=UPI0039EC78BC
MNKQIFCNYYQDNDPERRKEILYCIQTNLDLDFIEKINVFISNDERNAKLNQSPEEDLLSLHNSHKLNFIHIPSRLRFSDIVNYCSNNLEPTYIGIFINLDIFLENSLDWKNVETFFKKSPSHKSPSHQKKSRKIFLSLRHNFLEEEWDKASIEADKKSWKEGDFTDCYAFESNFLKDFINEKLDFRFSSTPGSDALLTGIFNKHYQVFSLGKKYKIFHYDIAAKKNYKKKIFFQTKDISVVKRLKEWVSVPSNQNWEAYLSTGECPKVQYVYSNKENLLIKSIYLKCKIFYIVILFRIMNIINSFRSKYLETKVK